MFTHKKYSFPEIIQENTSTGRYYVANGKRYPSVTTVLSEYSKKSITAWRKRVGEEEADRISRYATSRGTKVHSTIEHYLNNNDMSSYPIAADVKPSFVQLKPQLKKIDNIHCLETRMFSDNLCLAGTVDCIAEYNGVLSIIDFKTSKKIKWNDWVGNYFMQCAAYSQMFHELTGIYIDDIVIMIAVDETIDCQVITEKASNHIDELKRYIDIYNEKTQGNQKCLIAY